MRLVCVYDGDDLVWTDDYDGYKCSGSGNGSLGEMCGGCVACLMMQAEHGGLRVEVEMGFKIGDKVRTVAIVSPPTGWTPEVAARRRFGVEGMVYSIYNTGHGEEYEVQHDDGGPTGRYEARELEACELEAVQRIATVGDLIDALWGFPRSAPVQICYEVIATRRIVSVHSIQGAVEIEAEDC